MPAVTISANVDSDVADRIRSLASSEHRSVSNLVSAALLVFSDLPKGVRDTMLETRVDDDARQLRLLTREMEAAVARYRFDRAAAAMAAEKRFDPDWAHKSELEVMEAATAETAEFAPR